MQQPDSRGSGVVLEWAQRLEAGDYLKLEWVSKKDFPGASISVVNNLAIKRETGKPKVMPFLVPGATISYHFWLEVKPQWQTLGLPLSSVTLTPLTLTKFYFFSSTHMFRRQWKVENVSVSLGDSSVHKVHAAQFSCKYRQAGVGDGAWLRALTALQWLQSSFFTQTRWLTITYSSAPPGTQCLWPFMGTRNQTYPYTHT